MTEKNELTITEIQGLTPTMIFNPGTMDSIIKGVRKKALSYVPDLTTAKGRKGIASNASDVAKLKTRLDGLRKKLVSEWKEKAKLVDIEGKKMRDALDELKIEVRQPLTDWEEAEERRKEDIEGWIRAIKLCRVLTGNESSTDIEDKLKNLNNFAMDDTLFSEFLEDAKMEKEQSSTVLTNKLISLRQYEKDQAELAELRAEKEKKEQEERVAREAQEKKDAEEQAERERKADAKRLKKEAEEKAKKKVEAKAKAEIERIENEKREAIEKQLEAERKVKQAEQDAKDRARERVADIALARKREREQIEAERLKKEEEDRRRWEDEEHQEKIEAEVLVDLKKCLGNELMAQRALNVIVEGAISHVSINY